LVEWDEVMKKEHFRIGKSIYMIVFFIFIFGVFLEVTQTDFILKTYRYQTPSNELKTITKTIKIPEDVLAEIEDQPFLIIYDSAVKESIEIKDNIKQTLNYMKQKSEEVQIESIPPNFESYQMVIVTFEDIDQFPSIGQMETYVSNGGKFFFAIRPDLDGAFYKLYRKLGIFDVGGFTTATGIELNSNILMNQKGLIIEEKFIENSILTVSLENRAKVYAESYQPKYPLIWDVEYGKGKFMVFNGTMLLAKDNRGLIAGAMSVLLDDYMYPVMNMKLAYLDDFPAPIPQGYNEKIYNELKLDIPTFYRNIWWPFIQKQSAKYNLKYTAVVIESYNDRVTPPFNSESDSNNYLIKYGREVLKMGGEIGVHGYNHQSLVTDQNRVEHLGYRSWPNKENMVSSLNSVESHINQAFPGYHLATYVPPSNAIDLEGIEAISIALPTITNISAIYLPDGTQTALEQEFGSKGSFIYLPRFTSGHEYSVTNKWTIANGINSIGVFSHFIHPDDILDGNRSGEGDWAGMSKGLNSLFKDVQKKYPWLISMKASEAADFVKRFEKSDIYIVDKANKKIGYIDHFSGEVSFILRTDKKIGKVQGCKVEKIDNGIFHIRAFKETFEVELR
jgi:hypothetical protein